MAQFIAGQSIETKDKTIEVTVSTDKPLPIGVNRFQLVVKDDSGNLSQPAVLEVIIRDTQAPTAVIDFANADGTPLPNAIAEAGKSFNLSGARSSDVAPGKVVSYVWTLLAPDISRPVITPTRPDVIVTRPT